MNFLQDSAVNSQISISKARFSKKGRGLLRGFVRNECARLEIMPSHRSSRKSSKQGNSDYYPTRWSDWEWTAEHKCHVRYRLDRNGEYEFEYEPARDEAIPNTDYPIEEAQISQLYGEIEHKETQAIDQETIHNTVQVDGCERGSKMTRSQTQEYGSGESSKEYEELDSRFTVHAPTKFTFGRVFKVLWSEPVASKGTEITASAITDSLAYHKIRRFVIIKAGDRHALCLPIQTYSDKGANKRGIKLDNHGFIYSKTSKERWKSARESKDNMGVRTKHQDEYMLSEHDAESRVNYAKTYTIEHIVKVCFIGRVDKGNMERLLCGDPAWERSDTGEDIPIIMEDQVYPSFGSHCLRFQLLNKHAISNKTMALLGLSSGLLMSSSFVWLNKRMELYEPSEAMNKTANCANFHPQFGRLSSTIPNEIIFFSFLLGAAGLTGTIIAGTGRSQNQAGLIFGLALAGTVVSSILGFSAEEMILVCLPLILGFSILCGSMLQGKKVELAERDEKAGMISEV